MRITRSLILGSLLTLTSACASAGGGVQGGGGYRGSQKIPKTPLQGGIAEFHVTSYDGHDLKGRVLLGATVDPLVMDGRLLEGKDVELEKVRACDKTEPLPYLMADLFSSPQPDDIITIRRKYWYGGNVSFFLFNEETGPGPDCFEAELVLRVRGGRIAARLPIRVVRTDKTPPERRTGEPKSPTSDAGAP